MRELPVFPNLTFAVAAVKPPGSDRQVESGYPRHKNNLSINHLSND